MNRERILIVNNNMHIGGVQKALANLLCEIHSDYDITLLLFYKGGELLKDVPPDVKVMDAAAPFRYLGMSKSDAVRVCDKLFRFFLCRLHAHLRNESGSQTHGTDAKKDTRL